MKPLPNDYSRCIGAMDDAGESLHPQCQQCRRTVPARLGRSGFRTLPNRPLSPALMRKAAAHR